MIEPVTATTLPLVLPLIREYFEFYRVTDIDDKRNAAFFAQFSENSEQGCLFTMLDGDKALGFATVYFSFASTITAKVGVLNDLYTQPSARGKGIATQLIEAARDHALNKGCARLQWVTAPDNAAARRLYDKLDTQQSSWQFYTLPTCRYSTD